MILLTQSLYHIPLGTLSNIFTTHLRHRFKFSISCDNILCHFTHLLKLLHFLLFLNLCHMNIQIHCHRNISVSQNLLQRSVKSPTKRGVQLAGTIFQTRSRACLKNAFREMCFTLQASWTTNVQDDVGEFIPNL